MRKFKIRINDDHVTAGHIESALHYAGFKDFIVYEVEIDKCKGDVGREHDAQDDLPKFIEDQREMEVGCDSCGEPID